MTSPSRALARLFSGEGSLAVPDGTPRLPAASAEGLRRIAAIEDFIRALPQEDVRTRHVLHGGMYARTIRMRAGKVCFNVLIRIPTLLVVSGHCRIHTGDGVFEIKGHCVLPCSPGRKNVAYALSDTDFTMVFPTTAQTVEEAEDEFTDDAVNLASRKSTDDILILTGVSNHAHEGEAHGNHTGEQSCLE
jgi:hypothetical protein